MRSRLRTERVPEDGGSRPASIFNKVDLPDPFGPTRPMWSPSKIPKDRPSKSGAAPNALARSCAERRRSAMRANDLNVIDGAEARARSHGRGRTDTITRLARFA